MCRLRPGHELEASLGEELGTREVLLRGLPTSQGSVVLAGVAERHALDVQHKFVYELGWRDYFRHVWQHRGDGILQSLHEGPLPDAAYARELPADIRAAATGVPVVDEAVRALYATGMLHNHARMWLAIDVVHARKASPRAHSSRRSIGAVIPYRNGGIASRAD